MAAIGAQIEGARPVRWEWATSVVERGEGTPQREGVPDGDDTNCFCGNAREDVIAHPHSNHPDRLHHRAHRACLQANIAEGRVTCPTCRAPFNPNELPKTWKERVIQPIWNGVKHASREIGQFVSVAIMVSCMVSGLFMLYTTPLTIFQLLTIGGKAFSPLLWSQISYQLFFKEVLFSSILGGVLTIPSNLVCVAIHGLGQTIISKFQLGDGVASVVHAIFALLGLAASIATSVALYRWGRFRITSLLPTAKSQTAFDLAIDSTWRRSKELWDRLGPLSAEEAKAAFSGMYRLVGFAFANMFNCLFQFGVVANMSGNGPGNPFNR